MQSTEEYLDQLLASVSDEATSNDANINQEKRHKKSIEELDESELTEEVLQKQLALLLGLETEDEDEYDSVETDDFMSEYTMRMANSITEPEVQNRPVEAENTSVKTRNVPEITESVPVISETGTLSDDEIAALFASMEAENNEQTEPIKEESTPAPVPAVSDSGTLSDDEIAALFASMAAEDNVQEEPAPVPVPAVSDSGTLSDDEIAALFASMAAETSTEDVTEQIIEEVIEPEPIVEKSETSAEAFDNHTLSPEEIASLFATMGEDTPADENQSGLTRAELEELGLGDIADVLVEEEQEDSAETILEELAAESETMTEMQSDRDNKQVVEIPSFDFDEEVLLDIENVEEMLEATAKLAEEETTSFDADMQAEEDIMSMLTQFEEESIQENAEAIAESTKAAEAAVSKALDSESENSEELSEEPSQGKKKRKKEKVKKEKVKKEKPKKEKKDKVSLKDKIAAFMFEDDSLDVDGKIPLGDGDTLEYMDIPTEEAAPVKAKKEKKEKAPKKAKKDKAEKKSAKGKDENAEIAAELAAEDKKKAQKKEKPKKEKKVKKVVIADDGKEEESKDKKRGIGTKGIVATLLVCASILGLILVGTYFLPQQLSLAAARVAFYAQDYEEVSLRLKDKKLSDSDRIMYEKASLLYGLQERYHQAEIYSKRGMTKEHLNALLQGVIACNEENVMASGLGIEAEWQLEKDRFVKALKEQYGLDAGTVEMICGLRNPNYTVAVENILAGRPYNDMSAYGGEVAVKPENGSEEMPSDNVESGNEGGLNPEEMEDLLPEEEAIIEQMQQEENSVSNEDSSVSENDTNDVLYSGTVEDGAINFVE